MFRTLCHFQVPRTIPTVCPAPAEVYQASVLCAVACAQHMQWSTGAASPVVAFARTVEWRAPFRLQAPTSRRLSTTCGVFSSCFVLQPGMEVLTSMLCRKGDYEHYLCGKLMPSAARDSFFVMVGMLLC